MKTDDLIQFLARQPAALPRPRLAREWGLASLAGLAVALGLMLATLGPRPGLAAALGSPLFLHKLAALALFAGVSSLVAYRAGLPGRDIDALARRRWIIPAWLLLGALVVLATAPAGARLAQFSSSTILACLASIPLLSAPVAAALVLVLRRAAPTEPARAAGAVGWAAGGFGAFAYALHCPQDAPGYLLVWYGIAVSLTVLLTQAIATRWLRW